MSVGEWLPFALSLAGKIENITSYLVEGLKETIHYGPGMEKARLALQLEAESFAAIKRILFGRPGAGDGLFVDLPASTQLDILNVLRHFKECLGANITLIDKKYHTDRPSLDVVASEMVAFGSYHSSSVVGKLRWGFSIKSKVDRTVRELRSWNGQLRSIIELRYIESSFYQLKEQSRSGEMSALVRKIQNVDITDAASSLGLPSDVKLARFSFEMSDRLREPFLNLETLDRTRYHTVVHTDPFAQRRLVQVESETFLLEFRDFDANEAGQPSSRSVTRVQQLANLLHEADPVRYRTLKCEEYFIETQQFAFAFALPPNVEPRYTTLFSMLQQSKPDLEDRFALASELASALARFHAVGWVHKSLRSANILFFNKDGIQSPSERKVVLDEPYLSGWEYSRPESEFSSRINDNNDIREDVYRHPNQWGAPTVKFNRSHDIYALGVVLLEIGIWKTAESMHPSKFRNALGSSVREFLIHYANHQRLRASVGRRYQSVVLKCLQGDFERGIDVDLWEKETSGGEGPFNKDDSGLLKTFNIEVVQTLEEIATNM